MPFVKRTIEPIRIGLNGGAVTECRNELQQVTAISLVDVMRQLSSLSMHVQDMFGELHREASLIVERTLRLNEKVESLRSEINQLNPIVEEVSLQDINLRKPFKFSSLKDQQIITIATRPHCISTIYASCEPPPALQKLNACRSDGKDSLKFYTDPGYFFELWCQAMQKESKSQMKKHKKSRKTGTISSKPGTISSKSHEDNQKWSLDKVQNRNKENISGKSVEQQKQLPKIPPTIPDTSLNKSSNSKQRTIPTRASLQKIPKADSTPKPQEKTPETAEQSNKKVEHCAKECQTPEEKIKPSEIPKSKAEHSVAENTNLQKPADVAILPSKSDGCIGVLDLSNRNQNLYENALSLISKENTYENALALLNDYNNQLENEEGADSKNDSVVRDEGTEVTPVNLSLKAELDGDMHGWEENDSEKVPAETSGLQEPTLLNEADQPHMVVETTHTAPQSGTNRSRLMNLPPAPPTPPELYEGARLNSEVGKLLEDVQKKTAAMKAASPVRGEDNFDGGLVLPKAGISESMEEVILAGEVIEDVVGIDFSDLSDLPPIPSPPKFPPFVDVSGVSSPVSFPSPPTPAYNQHHTRMSQFSDEKESLAPNNNNNIIVLDSLPVKLGDETSVTSEMSAISSESESSVINSSAVNEENLTGEVRDTRCDLLAAIREGIQLRKVEECRQKIERKTKPTGRLDVQSIMEVAFEMRRKMLEEDDSEEDEEEMETNWSDED